MLPDKRESGSHRLGKNIRSDNPDLNVSQGISRVSQQNFIIKLTKLVTEKIPIIITQPIGEAPRGYQFLDIWPYQLFITVSGPEDQVKHLKSRGLKLTFNLNDISRTQLDELGSSSIKKHSDVVSFFVPNNWKQISFPFSPQLRLKSMTQMQNPCGSTSSDMKC